MIIHDVFISYSRQDTEFARKLEKALEDFKPPKDLDVPQRHLDVFRDENDFSHVDYKKALRKYLQASAKLIVICSPNAWKSDFVDEEIQLFATLHGADNIIPVLLSGIPNNTATSGQEDKMAFPQALCNCMEMPLAMSYVGFDLRRGKVDKGEFRNSWYSILANIYGISRAELEQREQRREAHLRRKIYMLMGAAILLLAIAFGFSLFYWIRAEEHRKIAEVATLSERGARATVLGEQPGRELEALTVALQAAGPALNNHPETLAPAVIEGLATAVTAARYSFPLRGHAKEIDSATFSPDGTRVITASADEKGVRLWDTNTHKLIATRPYQGKVAGREIPITAASISSDSERLVLPGPGNMAQIWSVRTGKLIKELQGHADGVNTAIFSSDGQLIATSSTDGTARVWSVSTGEFREFKLERSRGAVTVAILTPDGSRLLTAHQDFYARQWDIASSTVLKTFRIPRNFVTSAAYSQDGRQAFIAGLLYDLDTDQKRAYDIASYRSRHLDATIFSPDNSRLVIIGGHVPELLDTQTGKPSKPQFGDSNRKHDSHTGDINFATFSPDGTHIVSASQDSTAKVWDAIAGNLLKTLHGHVDRVFYANFSSDGRYVVTASGDRTARIWDTQMDGLEPLITLAAGSQTTHFDKRKRGTNYASVSPDNGQIITAHDDGKARIWDDRTGNFLYEMETREPVQYAAFSPDGLHLVTSGESKAFLWNTPTDKSPVLLQGRVANRNYPIFSPDGNTLLTISDKAVFLSSASTGETIQTIVCNQPRFAFFSPDGQTVAVGVNYRYRLDLFDSKGGNYLNTAIDIQRHNATDNSRIMTTLSVEGLDGVYVAKDWPARVWDLRKKKVLTMFEGSTDAIESAAFSPDGTRIVTLHSDRIGRVWDVSTGAILATIKDLTESRWSPVFSPTGEQILSTEDRFGVRLLDESSGRLLATFGGNRGNITSATFSADGRRIAILTDDATVRIYSSVKAEIVKEYITAAFNLLCSQSPEFEKVRTYEPSFLAQTQRQ